MRSSKSRSTGIRVLVPEPPIGAVRPEFHSLQRKVAVESKLALPAVRTDVEILIVGQWGVNGDRSRRGRSGSDFHAVHVKVVAPS